jgi:hypothetical protein
LQTNALVKYEDYKNKGRIEVFSGCKKIEKGVLTMVVCNK